MIQTASILGLAKTVFIIFLAYSIFKYITRLLAPWIVRSMSRKMTQKFNQTVAKQNPKREGHVSIDKNPTGSSTNKDVGEYVDYEELN